MHLPWFTALVSGPSMAPTLRSGDRILVRRTTCARPGDLVVAAFRARPGLLVVKRVERADGDGWWIVGDNPFGSDDSSRYGTADVIGRVTFRWWPQPMRFRRVPG
ncbi:S24/S26 family peptidase [Dactylosporangium sp. NPDC051485]|uniref:S24/S26 family peptidase n=1 Tax=Dactylosporangium sp. NPDC051485 TaxID=3154846 RepID=UPI0034248590